MGESTIINLKEWNSETYHYQETGQTVSTHQIARSMTPENFAKLFDAYLNIGGKGLSAGKEIGLQLRFTHRTLQRLVVCFCLGMITGISEQDHTDARNEIAIKTAKKVTQLLEAGELPTGFYL
jgi:hypothetical protein